MRVRYADGSDSGREMVPAASLAPGSPAEALTDYCAQTQRGSKIQQYVYPRVRLKIGPGRRTANVQELGDESSAAASEPMDTRPCVSPRDRLVQLGYDHSNPANQEDTLSGEGVTAWSWTSGEAELGAE